MVANPPSENIYIKGLPTDSNENDLVNVFAQFGRILSCTRIATTGIIGFQSVEEATRAVKGANGSTLLGGSVPLVVTFKSQICRAFAQTGRCQWDTGVNLVTIEDIRKVCIFSFYVTYSFLLPLFICVQYFSPRTYTTRGYLILQIFWR